MQQNTKRLIDLGPGDFVKYKGLDGIERTLEFVRTLGAVESCIVEWRGRYCLCFLFADEAGRQYQVPLDAFHFTRVPYEILTPGGAA